MAVKKINKYFFIFVFALFGFTNPVFAASDYNHGLYSAGLYGFGQVDSTSRAGENLIVRMSNQLNVLQKKIDEKKVNIPQTTAPTVVRTLKIGMTGEDVRALQTFLNTQGFKVSTTSYFGPITKNAVTKFQELYFDDILKPQGLKKGSGIYGPSTRAKVLQIQKNATIKSIH